jgi:dihydroorotase
MRIDPHVHCRDGAESYKETIEHVLRLCDAQGVDVIFDMPNTSPPILSPRDVETRMKLVPSGARDRYRLFVGATANERQLAEAAELIREYKSVVGLKLYAGESVGSLAIISEEDQQNIYRRLADINYKGVLAVHCEKKSLIDDSFNPKTPVSHALARKNLAETEAITDQIRFALDAHFQGTLHICHVSTAESVRLVNEARGSMRITCGATPHHLLWTSAHYLRPDGLLYKVNPPLRAETDVLELRSALRHNLIDWIETDHAPHPLSEKLYPPYASGYPSLCLYRELVEEILPSWGLDEKAVDKLTRANIVRVFSGKGIE